MRPLDSAGMAFDFSQVGKRSDVPKLGCAWKDVVLYLLGIGARAEKIDFLIETSGPRVVFPGDTLVSEGWRAGDRVLLSVTIRERGEPVLTHAFAEVN